MDEAGGWGTGHPGHSQGTKGGWHLLPALPAPLPAARGAGQCQRRSQDPEWGQERLTWPAWLMLRPGVPTAHTEGLSLAVPEGSLTHC